jgi:hypothetical protein
MNIFFNLFIIFSILQYCLGGAIAFETKGNASITECVFDNCDATNIGGAIWSSGDGQTLTSLKMSHIFFINSVSTTNKGEDISFENSDETTMRHVLTFSNISSCRSQNDENNLLHKLEVVKYNGEVLNTVLDRSCLLPPFLSSALYVGANNITGDGGYKCVDRQYCGTESVRCRTITFGDTTTNPLKDTIIYVSEGEYEESEIKSNENIKKTIIGISSSSSSQTIIYSTPSSVKPSSLFNIPSTSPNSTLIISKITLIEREHVGYTHHLFSITGDNSILDLDDIIITCENIESIIENEVILFSSSGIVSFLHINKVLIKNIFLSVSCLRLLDGSARICGCEFYNISVNSGNGSVFFIETKKLKIIEFSESCKFENCSIGNNNVGGGGSGSWRSNGDESMNGGGIYCILNEGGIFIVGGGTSFINCSAKSSVSEEGKGYIFIILYLSIIYFILFFFFMVVVLFM